MVSKRNWKAWVVLGVAVAVFVTSGGLLMASNMGFKINKALATVLTTGQTTSWISVPYNSPYQTFRDLCRAIATGSNVPYSSAMISTVNVEELLVAHGAQAALNGQNRNQACFSCCNPAGSGAACTEAVGNCTRNLIQNQDNTGVLQPGMSGSNGGPSGVRIRITGATAASPSSVVLVGSSIETQNTPKLIPNAVDAAAGPFCAGLVSNNWISVPYHTMWLKASDVCVSLGTTAPAAFVRITRLAATGILGNYNCGVAVTDASNFGIVIGESIRICDTNAPVNLPSAAPGGILVPHF